MSIGERLRQERERIGLTQPVLADLVGSSKRTVIDWEKGVSYPNALALSVLAKSGIDFGYVVTGVPAGDALEPDEGRLLALYRLASTNVQAAVMAALAAGMAPQRPSADMHVVVHGSVGQQITGGNHAPQTINVGTSRPRKRVP